MNLRVLNSEEITQTMSRIYLNISTLPSGFSLPLLFISSCTWGLIIWLAANRDVDDKNSLTLEYHFVKDTAGSQGNHPSGSWVGHGLYAIGNASGPRRGTSADSCSFLTSAQDCLSNERPEEIAQETGPSY